MKTRIKNLFLLALRIAALGLILASPVTAQTFTNLHSFTSGSDGANSTSDLILSGDTLYGTASAGGSGRNGTVFAINTDGTAFTNLHSFALSDGINPFAGLILSGNTLYGTASQGGRTGNGAVFAINTDSTGFATLYSFTGGADGANPYTGLVISGNRLYGTTLNGGREGNGAVFAINADSTGFATLYSFTGGNDGGSPDGGLVLAGNTLYGTVSQGGSTGNGAVFAVNTDSTGFTNIYSFTGGSDGASPFAGLFLSGAMLYGTTYSGGGGGGGTVFAISTNGLGFTNLYSFTGGNDGANPKAVIVSGNMVYGTAGGGGTAGNGTLFAINTESTVFTNLYEFTANPSPKNTNSDGAFPRAGLFLSSNTLYGTTFQGGNSDNGTVFALTLSNSTAMPPSPIPLEIELAGNAVVLSWTDPGFTLQSAPAAAGVFTNLPGSTSPYTNSSTSKEQFFRLISNGF